MSILDKRTFYLLLFLLYNIVNDGYKLFIFILMGAVFYYIALHKYISLIQDTQDGILKHFKEECNMNNITINKILQVGRDVDGGS